MSDSSSRRDIARQCRVLLKEAAKPDLVHQLQQWAVECDSEADDTLRASPISDLLDQARRHRLRAEEYRAVVEQMQTPAARGTYQQLAETYEAMARRLEEIAVKSCTGDRDAG